MMRRSPLASSADICARQWLRESLEVVHLHALHLHELAQRLVLLEQRLLGQHQRLDQVVLLDVAHHAAAAFVVEKLDAPQLSWM